MRSKDLYGPRREGIHVRSLEGSAVAVEHADDAHDDSPLPRSKTAATGVRSLSASGQNGSPLLRFGRATDKDSDQGALALEHAGPAGDVEQSGRVQHFARPVVPADQLSVAELLERLVGVHDREPERIGYVLLRNRDEQRFLF